MAAFHRRWKRVDCKPRSWLFHFSFNGNSAGASLVRKRLQIARPSNSLAVWPEAGRRCLSHRSVDEHQLLFRRIRWQGSRYPYADEDQRNRVPRFRHFCFLPRNDLVQSCHSQSSPMEWSVRLWYRHAGRVMGIRWLEQHAYGRRRSSRPRT